MSAKTWATTVLEEVPALKMVVLAAKMASQKSPDGPSQDEIALRRIEDKIMMFWELMRRHSKDPNGVTYQAYEGLHLRISKSLTNSFSRSEALTISRQDWKADSVLISAKKPRGEKRSAIDDVKYRFRAASYKLGAADWQNLFRQYDKDGNGELDELEFAAAVRKYVSKEQLSDEELILLFRDVDDDGGGTIDAGEFEAFFFQGTLNQNQFFGSMWELAELWALEDANGDGENIFNPVRDAENFCTFLQDIYDNITVSKVKRADGTIVKVKGGTELRAIATGTDDYDLENLDAIRDREPKPEDEDEGENEDDGYEEPEEGDMFASMEDIEVLEIAAAKSESEDEPEPEPEAQKPTPEPEPEPEPVVCVAPADIVRFSLDIILRGVDRAIEAKVREANLASQGPSFAEKKQRLARKGVVKTPARGTIDMATAAPLYGYRIWRQEVDPAARPNGRPALGLRNQSTPQAVATDSGTVSGDSKEAKASAAPEMSETSRDELAVAVDYAAEPFAASSSVGAAVVATVASDHNTGAREAGVSTPTPPTEARRMQAVSARESFSRSSLVCNQPAAASHRESGSRQKQLPTIRGGLVVSCRAGEIWRRGRGMNGGEGLAEGPGSTQVWLPRGDLSLLSPRSSLRNSSSLTLAVAAVRKQQQQRLQTPHVTADGFVTSSHWSTRSQLSTTSRAGDFGGVFQQDSLSFWQSAAAHSHQHTTLPSKLVWRANSGSLDGGYGVRTMTLNGSVHTQESRERMDAARAHLASEGGMRKNPAGTGGSVGSRGRHGPKGEVRVTKADLRPPMRSPRVAVHHGARVLHAIPPQGFGTVQHTLRDWKRLVPHPHPPERCAAPAAMAANGAGGQRLGTPPLAKLRESLMSPTASPRPPTAVTASLDAPTTQQLPRFDTDRVQQFEHPTQRVPPRLLQPAEW